ncbi:MAG: hypothetical protein COU27_00710 [Candidatus Levybacteria bacterium CG10_big_fil_rev_8_21_14_0_10_36_7]|nr:MAG: hypothetical protein COU27_00710 [Candidatus Levybacteria bacterium CG10_big_fil_rev_8_21_14_0_10_36_7]
MLSTGDSSLAKNIEFYLWNADREQTVAEKIVSILSKSWPLTLKEIHEMVAGKSEKVSHQATHKALKGLVKNRVLSKDGFKYELSMEWLKKLNNFSKAAIIVRQNKKSAKRFH